MFDRQIHFTSCLLPPTKFVSSFILDDLDIAPDFFNYFAATRPLLDRDPSIFCISAWNDNGGSTLVDRKRSDLLHRTDFFPGLGWMLKAEVGKGLLGDWPYAYWDDW